MTGVVRKAGATIELGVTVIAISESDSAVKISAGGRECQATSREAESADREERAIGRKIAPELICKC